MEGARQAETSSVFMKRRWDEHRAEMLLICKQGGQVKGKSRPPLSEDSRRQISETLKRKGCHPPWELSPLHQKGVKKADIIGAEAAERVRQATIRYNKGKVVTDETRIKMRLSQLGVRRSPHTAETKEKIRLSNIGKKRSLETIQKMREHGRRYAKAHPEIMAQKIKHLLENQGRKPTKPEMCLTEILQKYFPNEYRYVGDGQVWIARKNPDFIHNNDRRLIELYGLYWHKPEEADERIAHFNKYNFSTLIIWENELSDMDSLLEKIDTFNKGDYCG